MNEKNIAQLLLPISDMPNRKDKESATVDLSKVPMLVVGHILGVTSIPNFP